MAPPSRALSPASTDASLRQRKQGSEQALVGGATQGLSAEETKVRETKASKVVVRVMMSLLLMFSFLGIIFLGHPYLVGLVAILQTGLFKELVSIRYRQDQDEKIPLFRSTQWGLFFVAMLHTYKKEFLDLGLQHSVMRTLPAPLGKTFKEFMVYSSFVTFCGYVALFITYVLTLRKDTLKYQIGNIFWTIGVLCLIVLQIRGTTKLIFAGIFWFILPCGLVIANDCFAYICGMLCGRRFISAPFLSISPNKTWEGFIGSVFCTIAWAWIYSDIISRFPWLVCPQRDLTPYATLHCEVHSNFRPQTLSWPFQDYALFHFQARPVQIHAVKLAFFASFVAPFGGFLASGMKRAYNIKDFGALIPGHGGFMDRMDCQLLMLLFTFVYYQTFVLEHDISEDHILHLLSHLSDEGKRRISEKLTTMLPVP